LASLDGLETVVVDDGSARPELVRAEAQAVGARCVQLVPNAGPAAARNAGMQALGTAFVAFVDSDCTPPPGWLEALLPHFLDPCVAAVAPRIVPRATGDGAVPPYERWRSALDRGPLEALVRPGSAVPFVPTATLVVRTAAVSRPCFDESLRGGEDVDFVWRLVEAGWDVRYDPRVSVAHDRPGGLRERLGRQFFYGTTAGPLARRHPSDMHAAAVPAWALVMGTLLARRRSLLALGTLAVPIGAMSRRLRGRTAHPLRRAAWIVCAGLGAATFNVLGNLTRAWAPAIAAALFVRRTRRAAALALALPALGRWFGHGRPGNPLSFVANHVADDLAYGAGVWTGCVRARTWRPLAPRILLGMSAARTPHGPREALE
jgi:mycofactocin system glycosyltransferase